MAKNFRINNISKARADKLLNSVLKLETPQRRMFRIIPTTNTPWSQYS
jgi:hypothetical protein